MNRFSISQTKIFVISFLKNRQLILQIPRLIRFLQFFSEILALGR